MPYHRSFICIFALTIAQLSSYTCEAPSSAIYKGDSTVVKE